MLRGTRRGCHVDRTACVWLIRRFGDPEATSIFFGAPSEAPELFDVTGAGLSHHEQDYSFETSLKEYDLKAPVLAEIVHDADLMDEKYGPPSPKDRTPSFGGCNSPCSTTMP